MRSPSRNITELRKANEYFADISKKNIDMHF